MATVVRPTLSLCRFPSPCVRRTRYGASELHAIAAFVGGVAAQEAVKLITHQYLPLNNTFVYNGIAGVGGVFQV
jgi:amyloid beta precursor protein binding protein 1